MTKSILARDRVDLTNCDREPIHIPGAILPHGAMLVLDSTTLRVLQAAGDTQRLRADRSRRCSTARSTASSPPIR